MRGAAVLVLVTGCYGTNEGVAPASPPRVHSVDHEGSVPELTCPTRQPLSTLRGQDPQQGGYRIIEDEAELERVRAAMAKGTPVPLKNERQLRALWSAVEDLRPDIQQCMIAADGVHPELHYQFGGSLVGNSVGSMITGVSLQRIEGAKPDGTLALGKTSAESCVSDLLAHVVLPPGGDTFGHAMTVFRQDFCTPTIEIALQATRSYVDAYMRWWRAHPGQTCPAGLSELQGYGRDEGKDPWHRPYVMRCDATGFEVISGGPDRRVGTADDLSSHR